MPDPSADRTPVMETNRSRSLLGANGNDTPLGMKRALSYPPKVRLARTLAKPIYRVSIYITTFPAWALTVWCACCVTPRQAGNISLVLQGRDEAGRLRGEVGEVCRLRMDAQMAKVEGLDSEGADGLIFERDSSFTWIAQSHRVVAILRVPVVPQILLYPQIIQSNLLPCR